MTDSQARTPLDDTVESIGGDTVAVSTHGLGKVYAGMERPAIDHVSFSVAAGEVFALLGPNGAGKTTTLEILEGLRSSDAGSCRVLGYDPSDQATRHLMYNKVGMVIQELGADQFLTVGEAITQFSDFYDSPRRVEDTLDIVGLRDHRDRRVSTLSGGLKRRLDVGIGLVGNPDVLFLDEPTVGFDPEARLALWDTLRDLNRAGLTILLTTHYLEEAEALASRVGIIADGQLVAEGSPAQLRESLGGRSVITFARGELALDALPLPACVDGALVRIESGDVTTDVHALTGWAIEHRVELVSLRVVQPSLEELYLRLSRGEHDGDLLPHETDHEPADAHRDERREVARVNSIRLVLRQLRWHNITFWRNPSSAFFVIAFPFMMLFIFNMILRDVFAANIQSMYGADANPSAFLLGTVLVWASVTAMFSNTSINIAAIREEGVLKRVSGTPSSPNRYITLKLVNYLAIQILLSFVVVVVSAVAFDTPLGVSTVLGLLVVTTFAGVSYAFLGLALSTIIPTAEAALPVTNAFVLPILFISGVFVPESMTPDAVRHVAAYFPVAPLANDLHAVLYGESLSHIQWRHLAVLFAWGILGAIVWRTRHSWNPRR